MFKINNLVIILASIFFILSLIITFTITLSESLATEIVLEELPGIEDPV